MKRLRDVFRHDGREDLADDDNHIRGDHSIGTGRRISSPGTPDKRGVPDAECAPFVDMRPVDHRRAAGEDLESSVGLRRSSRSAGQDDNQARNFAQRAASAIIGCFALAVLRGPSRRWALPESRSAHWRTYSLSRSGSGIISEPPETICPSRY
jgi:hypothetical protein